MKILKVEQVSGSSLYRGWKSSMQVITTDEGEFIDNAYNRTHSGGRFANGHNWKEDEVYNSGEYEINTDRKTDHKWLNIPK